RRFCEEFPDSAGAESVGEGGRGGGPGTSRPTTAPAERTGPADGLQGPAVQDKTRPVLDPRRLRIVYRCSRKRAVFCAIMCHFVPMRGAQPRPARTGFTVAPGPAGRAQATDRCSRRCPERVGKAAAVVTGLESRGGNSETCCERRLGPGRNRPVPT